MVARISAQATMPLDRATYHGILLIGQLPLVVVCDVVVVDVLVDGVVVAVAEEDDEAPDVPVLALVDARFVLAAAVWVVVALCPSCQAMTPPSESIVATLSAA